MGGWVVGLIEKKVEEKQAVGISYCLLGFGWVGGDVRLKLSSGSGPTKTKSLVVFRLCPAFWRRREALGRRPQV